jgi:hypothetical protein
MSKERYGHTIDTGIYQCQCGYECSSREPNKVKIIIKLHQKKCNMSQRFEAEKIYKKKEESKRGIHYKSNF